MSGLSRLAVLQRVLYAFPEHPVCLALVVINNLGPSSDYEIQSAALRAMSCKCFSKTAITLITHCPPGPLANHFGFTVLQAE